MGHRPAAAVRRCGPRCGVVVALTLVALLRRAVPARRRPPDGRGPAPGPGPRRPTCGGPTSSAWHPVGVGSDTLAPPYLAVLAALVDRAARQRPSGRSTWSCSARSRSPAPPATSRCAAGSCRPCRCASGRPRRTPSCRPRWAPSRRDAWARRCSPSCCRWSALTAVRALGLDPRRGPGSTRAAWGAALLLAVATAFVPGVAGLVLALALLALLVVRGRDLLRLAILVVVPLALLLPWLPALVADPQLLLLEAGLPGPALSDADPEPLSLVLLHPGGPGLSLPWVLTAPLLLLALAALLRPDRRRPVLAGWVAGRHRAGRRRPAVPGRRHRPDPRGPRCRPGPARPCCWPGPAWCSPPRPAREGARGAGGREQLRLAAAGGRGARRAGRARCPWSWPAGGSVAGAGDPLDRRDPVLLPAFVAAEGDQPARPRTLVLRGPRAGRPDLRAAARRGAAHRRRRGRAAGRRRTHRAGRVVADLASGRGGDAAARLVPYGIRFVLLARPADPAAGPRRRRRARAWCGSAAPGGSVLWRVDYPHRPAAPPAGRRPGRRPGRRAARRPGAARRAGAGLGRPAPPGRPTGCSCSPTRATTGGGPRSTARPLEPPRLRRLGAGVRGSRPTAGRLALGHDQGIRTVLLWVQLAGVVLVAVLALPQVRTEEDEIDESDDRRRRRPGGQRRDRPQRGAAGGRPEARVTRRRWQRPGTALLRRPAAPRRARRRGRAHPAGRGRGPRRGAAGGPGRAGAGRPVGRRLPRPGRSTRARRPRSRWPPPATRDRRGAGRPRRAAGPRLGSAVLTPTRPGRRTCPASSRQARTSPTSRTADTDDDVDGPGPVAARGTGRSAPGLVAAQLTRSTEATMRGLAGVTCAPSGHRRLVRRQRRGRRPARPGLPHQHRGRAGRGGPDAVRPGRPDRRARTAAASRWRRAGQEVRLLDALAPGTERFAVHVHARQGRIAAAVRDQQVDGLTPLGADWVPAGAGRRPGGSWCPASPAAPASGGCRSSRPATPTASCGCGWSASPARSPRPGWTSSRSGPAR